MRHFSNSWLVIRWVMLTLSCCKTYPFSFHHQRDDNVRNWNEIDALLFKQIEPPGRTNVLSSFVGNPTCSNYLAVVNFFHRNQPSSNDAVLFQESRIDSNHRRTTLTHQSCNFILRDIPRTLCANFEVEWHYHTCRLRKESESSVFVHPLRDFTRHAVHAKLNHPNAAPV